MKPSTREVTRGKLESFAASAQVARDLFESYLSKPPNSAEKQEVCDRLLKVLETIRRNCDGLVEGIKIAVAEDA